jgi:AcrR family transcriptional regulator
VRCNGRRALAKQRSAQSRPVTAAGGTDGNAARKSDRTRQRILDAAARVFRDQGYAGATLGDIAASAGLQAGSLYYHFDSREALVDAVMAQGTRRAHHQARQRLAALPPGTTELAKLALLIESHLEMVLSAGDYTSAMVKLIWQVPAEIRERQLADQRAYGALWRQVLERARDAGEIRSDVNLSVARMAILGALNWAADWYRPGGDSPQQVARDVVTMVVEGLATKAPTKPKAAPTQRARFSGR